MFLILANSSDQVATGVARLLAARHGMNRVIFLSADHLAHETGWRQRLSAIDDWTEIKLPDGRWIDCRELSVVLNRLGQVSLPHFATASAADQLYASCEMFALLLSWLAGLSCPVINPVSARALSGAPRSMVEWMRLAAMAGLPTRCLKLSSEMQSEQTVAEEIHRALIIGGEVAEADLYGWAGDQAAALIEGCQQLAKLSRADLIECSFAHAADRAGTGWELHWATLFPTSLSEPEIRALTSLLEERAMRPFALEDL